MEIFAISDFLRNVLVFSANFFTHIALLSVCLLLSFYWWFNKTRNYPPTLTGYPIVGYYFSIGNEPYLQFTELAKKYGNIFSFFIGFQRFVVLNGYDVIKDAYISQANSFVDRPQSFGVIPTIVFDYKAMPFANGEPWKFHRKILMNSLKGLSGVNERGRLERNISHVTELLLQSVEQQRHQPIDLYDIFSDAALNSIGLLVCNDPFSSTHPEIAKQIFGDARGLFTNASKGDAWILGPIMRLLKNRFTQQYQNLMAIKRRQNKLFTEIAEKHIKNFDPNDVKDYIDMFLLEKKNLQDKNEDVTWLSETLIPNLFIYFVAGTDTTTSTLYFGAFALATNPEIQKRCQKEIDDVIGAVRLPEMSDKPKLHYFDAVVNEILRYSCIGAIPQSKIVKTDLCLQNYCIPANSHIIANLWSATRDPKYWVNPNNFDPDNFYRKQIPQSLASIVFSAGKRPCPGENLSRVEIFLFLSALLQKYTISVPDGVELKEEILPGFTRVLKPFKLQINSRN